jgi:hypothetical protein
MTEKIRKASLHGKIVWQKHALRRMLERGISRKEVKNTLENGEVVEEYPDDTPFASMLLMGKESLPIHVVAAYDEMEKMVYVITAYRPDSRYFEEDMKTRRKE